VKQRHPHTVHKHSACEHTNMIVQSLVHSSPRPHIKRSCNTTLPYWYRFIWWPNPFLIELVRN